MEGAVAVAAVAMEACCRLSEQARVAFVQARAGRGGGSSGSSNGGQSELEGV